MAEGGKGNVDDGKSTDGKKEKQFRVNFLFGKCHMIITSSLGLD